MRRQYSIAEARNQLHQFVRTVEDGPPMELTRRGKPVAILVSVGEFERLAGERPNRPDFWAAIERFRAEVNLEDLDIDGVLEGIRDPSPGREGWLNR